MSRRARTSATERRRTVQPTRSRAPWLIGIGLVAIAAVAALAALALTSGPTSVPEPATSPVTVTGAELPEYSATATDPAVGQLLPTLAGVGLDGGPMTIGPDGRAKAIVVLAHWCPHCQAEVPRLVAWLADHQVPDGVDLVAVSTAIDPARPNFPPSEWLDREGWAQPTLIDDAAYTAYRALGQLTFPGFVFVTADGRVSLRTTGELDVGTFGDILEELAP